MTPAPKIGQNRSSQGESVAQGYARDDRQEGGGDDVAETRDAVGERERRNLEPAMPRSTDGGGRGGLHRVDHSGRPFLGSGGARPRPERAPHDRGEDARRDAEHKPCVGRAALCADHLMCEQSARDDSGAGPREHQTPQGSFAERRQLHETPAGRVDEDECAREPGREAERSPRGIERQRHSQGEDAGADEADAHQHRRIDRWPAQARPHERLQRAQHCAGEIADVVRAREPARAVEIDDAVVQHHRQDRREREAADPHRDRERDQPGDSDARRAQRGRSTISTQFGLVPIGWSPSFDSAPLAPSMA